MDKTVTINAEGSLGVLNPKRAATELRIAAVTPFTTIDYPGILSAVAFIQGCPWRCPYCQNAWMQSRDPAPGTASVAWSDFFTLLKKRKGLLDGVVFSGGEPCLDPALPAAVHEVKSLGMKVGLHTSGAYPTHLKEVIFELDWIGLDVKGPPQKPEVFNRAAGRSKAVEAFSESFEIVRASGVSYEARTTAHPDLLTAEDILDIAKWLSERGCTTYALQIYRTPPGTRGPLSAVGSDYPGEEVEKRLATLFPKFLLRRN